MDDRYRRVLKFIRRWSWLLSVVALFFVGRLIIRLDPDVWRSLPNWRLGWLAASGALFLGWFASRGVLWHLISRRHGSQHAWRATLRIWAFSEFARYLPGGIWSFAAKWQGTKEGGTSGGSATQAMILENLGLVAGAIMVTAASLPGAWTWAGPLMTMAAYVFVVPLLWPRLYTAITRGATVPTWSRVEALGTALGYAATWVIFGLANIALYRAWPGAPAVALWPFVMMNVSAWLIGYLSFVTASGIGARELAFVGLSRSVLTSAAASFFAVMSRLVLIVSEVVFVGLVSIITRRRT